MLKKPNPTDVNKKFLSDEWQTIEKLSSKVNMEQSDSRNKARKLFPQPDGQDTYEQEQDKDVLLSSAFQEKFSTTKTFTYNQNTQARRNHLRPTLKTKFENKTMMKQENIESLLKVEVNGKSVKNKVKIQIRSGQNLADNKQSSSEEKHVAPEQAASHKSTSSKTNLKSTSFRKTDKSTLFRSTLKSITTTVAPSGKQNVTENSYSWNNRRKKVLIFTTMRSGSSFVGELFNQNDDFMYMFEPLRLQSLDNQGYNEVNEKPYLLWLDLFNCHIDKFLNISEKKYKTSLTSTFKRRAFISFCLRMNISNCESLNFDGYCESKKHIAIKEIVITRVDKVIPLLKENVSVIHLIRDPRAILNSILHVEPELARDFSQLHNLCHRLYVQIGYSFMYLFNKEDNYLLLRYEDIAANPEKYAREIYDFVDLPIPHSVINWIKDSTKVGKSANVDKKQDPFSTKRNSRSVTSAWKKTLNWKYVELMQNDKDCAYVLQRMKYEIYPDEAAYNSSTSFLHV